MRLLDKIKFLFVDYSPLIVPNKLFSVLFFLQLIYIYVCIPNVYIFMNFTFTHFGIELSSIFNKTNKIMQDFNFIKFSYKYILSKENIEASNICNGL